MKKRIVVTLWMVIAVVGLLGCGEKEQPLTLKMSEETEEDKSEISNTSVLTMEEQAMSTSFDANKPHIIVYDGKEYRCEVIHNRYEEISTGYSEAYLADHPEENAFFTSADERYSLITNNEEYIVQMFYYEQVDNEDEKGIFCYIKNGDEKIFGEYISSKDDFEKRINNPSIVILKHRVYEKMSGREMELITCQNDLNIPQNWWLGNEEDGTKYEGRELSSDEAWQLLKEYGMEIRENSNPVIEAQEKTFDVDQDLLNLLRSAEYGDLNYKIVIGGEERHIGILNKIVDLENDYIFVLYHTVVDDAWRNEMYAYLRSGDTEIFGKLEIPYEWDAKEQANVPAVRVEAENGVVSCGISIYDEITGESINVIEPAFADSTIHGMDGYIYWDLKENEHIVQPAAGYNYWALLANHGVELISVVNHEEASSSSSSGDYAAAVAPADWPDRINTRELMEKNGAEFIRALLGNNNGYHIAFFDINNEKIVVIFNWRKKTTYSGTYTEKEAVLTDGRKYTSITVEGHTFGYHFDEDYHGFIIDEKGIEDAAAVILPEWGEDGSDWLKRTPYGSFLE